jgi:hypothetical protein
MDDSSEVMIDEAEAIANDDREQVTIRRPAGFIRELARDLEGSNHEHGSHVIDLEYRATAIERDIQSRHDELVQRIDSLRYDEDNLTRRVTELEGR